MDTCRESRGSPNKNRSHEQPHGIEASYLSATTRSYNVKFDMGCSPYLSYGGSRIPLRLQSLSYGYLANR